MTSAMNDLLYINGGYPTSSIRPIPKCPYCGSMPHDAGVGACPEVKEIEYDQYGMVRRVVKR